MPQVRRGSEVKRGEVPVTQGYRGKAKKRVLYEHREMELRWAMGELIMGRVTPEYVHERGKKLVEARGPVLF